MDEDYDSYILREWKRFVDDPSRGRASLKATADIEVRRVLDVGCGAGQELFPFVTERGAFGVGTDLANTCGDVGREMYATTAPEARVEFLRSRAEELPFRSDLFDVVICRLAIPYTHNARALAEVSRVLRTGGRYLLKVHAIGWYLRKAREALKTRNFRSFVHAGRVVAAGSIYHMTRRQPHWRIPSRETFQSEWLLRQELKQHRLRIVGQTPDSNPLTPSFVIVKDDRAE